MSTSVASSCLNATVFEQLLWCDGPQLIGVLDRSNQLYVLVNSDDRSGRNLFFGVAVTKREYADLVNGAVDLRELMSLPQDRTRFIALADGAENERIALQPCLEFDPQWLPDAGFKMSLNSKYAKNRR